MRTSFTLAARSSTLVGCALLFAPAALADGPYATTLFTDIPGAVFVDIATDSSNTPFGPFIIPVEDEVVTITSSDQAGSSPAYFGFFNYDDSPFYHLPYDQTVDPGDYHGYMRSITPFVRHVVLDFDTPLTGFGLTFVIQRFFNAPDAPDTIYAYDGPDATGNQIASVTTVGAPATNFKAQVDFVGIYVDGPPIIRSVLVAGGPLADDYSELRITGIAVAIAQQTPPCVADINVDGQLNFFDVQAFLGYFAASDPLADFIDDGQFNFFDVQAFLGAFAAGCD